MQNDTEDEVNKQQLTEELSWVKYRTKILDVIDLKLIEMKELAQYAKDNILGFDEIDLINIRLKELSLQIKCLDEENKMI